MFGSSEFAQEKEWLPEEGDENKEEAKKSKKPDQSKESLKKLDELKKQVEEWLMKDAEKKLNSNSVQGKGRVTTGVSEELGFTIVITDICNYVGLNLTERHPCLKRETKKVGINALTFKNQERVVSLIYLEDFTNALI